MTGSRCSPQGGHLEQYDTPAALLGAPATAFVREFVGADRGIRRLAVTPLDRDALEPVPEDAAPDLPTVAVDGSAYDALAVLLTSGRDRLLVTDGGRPVGALSRQRLLDLGRPTS